jgi:hypothetical protein
VSAQPRLVDAAGDVHCHLPLDGALELEEPIAVPLVSLNGHGGVVVQGLDRDGQQHTVACSRLAVDSVCRPAESRLEQTTPLGGITREGLLVHREEAYVGDWVLVSANDAVALSSDGVVHFLDVGLRVSFELGEPAAELVGSFRNVEGQVMPDYFACVLTLDGQIQCGGTG